jgi:hypothetical protein
MQSGDGLQPSSQGKRVAFAGTERTVIDGPFPVVRELVTGFWRWEVESMDEAIEWVRKCPKLIPGPGEIEIHPLYEMEDFAEAMTPELQEQEARLRDRAGG